jgi:hypothetical protein
LDALFVDHARGRDWTPPQLSDAELAQIADTFFPDNGSAPVVVDGGQ